MLLVAGSNDNCPGLSWLPATLITHVLGLMALPSTRQTPLMWSDTHTCVLVLPASTSPPLGEVSGEATGDVVVACAADAPPSAAVTATAPARAARRWPGARAAARRSLRLRWPYAAGTRMPRPCRRPSLRSAIASLMASSG